MTQPILITIPLTAADLPLATSLLQHLTFLGQIPFHHVLFVADHSLTNEQIQPFLDVAKPLFPAGGFRIHTPCALPDNRYPHGNNFRFECAAKHIAANIKAPWIYIDPRCVPIRKGWIQELEQEYRAHVNKSPVMGQILTPETNGTAQKLVSSTAIYPPELPKRMMQRLVAQRGVDFEKSCADILVPMTHHTQLIWTHALNGSNALPSPPSIVTLVHTAQAKEFGAVVRGERPKPVAEVPPLEVATPSQPKSRSCYYHSGNLGDVIYALAAVKLAGGGKIMLGPRTKRTSPPDHPIKIESYDLLAPLIRVQPYISSVTFNDRYPGTDQAFDLNHYRDSWEDPAQKSRLNLRSIADAHCQLLGVLERHHPSQTWLTSPSPIRTGMFVLARSPRFQNPEFPWKTILKAISKRALFVGLPSEHSAFQKEFGLRIAYWECTDFLELARVISGSLGFIGNQSFPCSVAIGLGTRVCQETFAARPDCLFSRPNFISFPFTQEAFNAWSQ